MATPNNEPAAKMEYSGSDWLDALIWEKAFVKNPSKGYSYDIFTYSLRKTKWFDITLNNVNGKWMRSMTQRLNDGCYLLNINDLKYGLLRGCVSYNSRALLYAGVINFNAFLPVTAPVLLNAELFVRQMSIYTNPLLISIH